MAIIDSLKSCELFAGLSTERLERISALCRGTSFREGAIIFKEGDEATEFYILTSGRVVLEMEVRPVPSLPAIPTALEVVTQSQPFGWSAVVSPYVYTLTARCMTSCTALAIKSEMLRKLMADDTGLGFELMKHVARYIAFQLMNTRLRLVSGLGLVLLSKELRATE